MPRPVAWLFIRNAVVVQGNAAGIAIGGAPIEDDGEEPLGKVVTYDFEVQAIPRRVCPSFVGRGSQAHQEQVIAASQASL